MTVSESRGTPFWTHLIEDKLANNIIIIHTTILFIKN